MWRRAKELLMCKTKLGLFSIINNLWINLIVKMSHNSKVIGLFWEDTEILQRHQNVPDSIKLVSKWVYSSEMHSISCKVFLEEVPGIIAFVSLFTNLYKLSLKCSSYFRPRSLTQDISCHFAEKYEFATTNSFHEPNWSLKKSIAFKYAEVQRF